MSLAACGKDLICANSLKLAVRAHEGFVEGYQKLEFSPDRQIKVDALIAESANAMDAAKVEIDRITAAAMKAAFA